MDPKQIELELELQNLPSMEWFHRQAEEGSRKLHIGKGSWPPKWEECFPPPVSDVYWESEPEEERVYKAFALWRFRNENKRGWQWKPFTHTLNPGYLKIHRIQARSKAHLCICFGVTVKDFNRLVRTTKWMDKS